MIFLVFFILNFYLTLNIVCSPIKTPKIALAFNETVSREEILSRLQIFKKYNNAEIEQDFLVDQIISAKKETEQVRAELRQADKIAERLSKEKAVDHQDRRQINNEIEFLKRDSNKLSRFEAWKRKELAVKDAELSEFLLFALEQLAQYERHNGKGLPKDHQNYNKSVLELIEKLQKPEDKKTKSKIIQASQLSGSVHFKTWLWILLAGDEMKDESINKLRDALGRDPTRYIKYANNMQMLFDVLCQDVHGKSPLEIKHMKKENFKVYIRFFTDSIRESLGKFLECVF